MTQSNKILFLAAFAAMLLLLPGRTAAQSGTVTDDGFVSSSATNQQVNLSGQGISLIVAGPSARVGSVSVGGTKTLSQVPTAVRASSRNDCRQRIQSHAEALRQPRHHTKRNVRCVHRKRRMDRVHTESIVASRACFHSICFGYFRGQSQFVPGARCHATCAGVAERFRERRDGQPRNRTRGG